MLPFLGIFHIVALAAMTAYGVRATRMPPLTAVVATALILWSNLVASGQLLSLFGRLNVIWLYCATSLVLGVVLMVLIRALASGSEAGPESKWPVRRYEKELIWFCLLSGGVFAGLTVLTAATQIASNPDTIVYRFPRIVWYLAQGSLQHFAALSDPRIVYYPLNGVLLYWPVAIYQFSPVWFNAPTVIAWAIVAVTTYAFGRELGASRAWSVASAWLIALTPSVLVQAVSTNDEILAASALSAGLLFLFRWSRRGALLDLALGAAGLCLSVGTKLHAYFYWPYLIVLLVATMVHWRAVLPLLRPLRSWRGGAMVLTCVAMMVMMVASFIIFNLRATGQITDLELARQVLNTPYSVFVSLQNVAVYAAQIMLTPLADMMPMNGIGNYRAPLYAAFNAVLAPFFTWVNNGPAYMSVGYRFSGVASNQAVLFNEHTLMVGLNWLAGAVATAWLALHRKAEASRWALWIGLSFFAWFVCWASSTKYIEGIGVYIAYAAIVAAPATVFAFAPIQSRGWSIARWLCLGFVMASQLVTASNVMVANTSRSPARIGAAFAKNLSFPISVGFQVETTVKEELARATAGVTHHSINWGQPNWAYMAYNPAVPAFLQTSAKPYAGSDESDGVKRHLAYSRSLMPGLGDATLHIYPFPKFPAYGNAPLKITGKASPGLTLLGDVQFALGPEWAFAAGNGVETRHPDNGNYVVFTFYEVSNFGHDPKPVIQINPLLYGLGPNDDLEFRYTIMIDGVERDRTDWSLSPVGTLNTTGLTATNGVMRIEVRNRARNGAVDRVDVALRSTVAPELSQ